MAVIAAILAPAAVAQTVQPPTTFLFPVFPNAHGSVQTKSSDPLTLNTKNPFFDPSIGTNGQACVTCHEPFLGITISVPFIQAAFSRSDGIDPLFRPNDTANNPSTTTHSTFDYSLFLNLGVVRIGKTLPTGANAPDFTVVAADTFTNDIFAAPDKFPLTTDPQHPGVPTLSVFRRPLINTNVNFDSAVLWDGRANIENLGGVAPPGTPAFQVEGAIQTLLLGAGNDTTVNDLIADFMTGVFTDQVSKFGAGNLSALGATGGVANLLALSQSPGRPCVFNQEGNLTSFVAAVATPTTCEPVVVGGELAGGPPTFTLFDAWASLPNTPANAGRLSVARGQAVFNSTGCVFCHTVPNLGNNAVAVSPAGFKDIGTDSLVTLNNVKASATTPAEARMVQDMIDRVGQLPLYCLRPVTDTSTTTCGSDATDVVTTDPGRALVTGHIADSGNFKPPVLRNLAVRPPFYHAGRGPGSAAPSQLLQSEVRFWADARPTGGPGQLSERVVESLLSSPATASCSTGTTRFFCAVTQSFFNRNARISRGAGSARARSEEAAAIGFAGDGCRDPHNRAGPSTATSLMLLRILKIVNIPKLCQIRLTLLTL